MSETWSEYVQYSIQSEIYLTNRIGCISFVWWAGKNPDFEFDAVGRNFTC
jgi:hypothetical protein